MKKALLSLILFLSVIISRAQWTQKATFPASERMGTVNFVYNARIYVGGGLKQENSLYYAYSDIWCYDPQSNSWDSVSSYPGGNFYGGICFVIDSVAYMGMGANQNGTMSNKFYALNLNTKQWTQKANFPSYNRIYPISYALLKKGYVGCGVGLISGNQTMLSDHWQYDPSTNMWTEKAAYPGGASVGLASFSLNGKAYAGLGDDGSTFYNDFYAYDPALNSWDTRASFNGQIKSFPSCTSNGSYGYMIGGEMSQLVFSNELWRYDANNDSWKKSGLGFTGAGRRYGVFQLLNNKFYYGLGQTGASDETAAADFWEGNTPLSVPEKPEKAIHVYPNPVHGGMIFLPEAVQGAMVIYNALGQELLREDVAFKKAIDISHLLPGLYQLRIEGSSVFSGSFLVE